MKIVYSSSGVQQGRETENRDAAIANAASMIDYLCIAGTREGRVIEFVDHLHEHFIDPCVIQNAAYMPPTQAGFSIEMKPASLKEYQFKGRG